jgi:hypothetical protein
MKYTYTFNVFRYLVLLVIFGLLGSARLQAQGLITNTTYVVNGAQDLVAPVDTFANLTGPSTAPSYGALTYLNQYGMNNIQTGTGQVTFLLSAGYNPIEPNVLNIGAATGSGGWPNMYWNANSPIVIKPAAGQNFTITTSATIAANTGMVKFNGAWFVSIDGSNGSGGRNLTFKMPTTATQTTSRVIDILPTSGQRVQFIGIKNCNIIGNSNATIPYTYAGIYFGGATSGTAPALGQNQNIDVINNYIIGVQNGVYFRGIANAPNLQNKFITIRSNIIGDYTNTFSPGNTAFIGTSTTALTGSSGIYVNAISNSVISNNTIRNSILGAGNFRGIFLNHEGGTNGMSQDSNVQVIGNTIYNLNTTASSSGVYGIRMNLGTHGQHLRILIANNSISKLSATAAQANIAGFAYPIGILIEDVSANVGAEVFFNSVYLTGSTLPAGSFSASFATSANVTGGIIMMNNSFANKMGRLTTNNTGYTIYNVLTLSPNTPFRYSSLNNYYTNTLDGGMAYVARVYSKDYTSLKGFAMNHRSDSTSYSFIPPFKNDSDLTVNAGVSHRLLNAGVNLPMFYTFYQSIYDSIRFKVNIDIQGNSRANLGRFTSVGCHVWAGDSTNNNVALVGPRVFPINGYSQWPTALNLNASFETVAEAIDYINHYGTGGSGNVTLEIQPGYAGETTHLPAFIDYPNSSVGRPVIFRAQTNFSTTLSFPNAIAMNNASVLRFLGATHVTFDGGTSKNITFQMPPLATNVITRVIGLTPIDTASNNITIKNCKIIGNSSVNGPNTGMGIYVGNAVNSGTPLVSTKGGSQSISFIGNEIMGVRSGIEFWTSGTSPDLLIKSNIIGGNIPTGTAQNTTFIGGASNTAGIRVKGVNNCVIDSNIVRNCVTTGSNSNGFVGILLDEAGAPLYSNVSVTRNFVYNLKTLTGTGVTGIRAVLANGAGPRGIYFTNNFVGSVVGNGNGGVFSNLNPTGISIDAATVNSNVGIYLAHNTVNLTGVGLGTNNSGSAALFLGANVQGGVELANNIFGNRLTRTSASGKRFAVLVGHTASPFTTASSLPFAINNNNYFAEGADSNFVGASHNGTFTRPNINNWRSFTAATPPTAGLDGNSFNWVNTFKTDTTPDIDLINGGKVPGGASIVTGICNDIYGNPRFQCPGGSSTVTRWVGAAEVGTIYPALIGNTTYQINGIDNPPTPLNPTSGSFKTVRKAIEYLNSQGVDDPNFGGFRTIRLEIASGYVGETDTFIKPITVLDFPRMAPTRPVVLAVASGRTDTIRVVSNVNPAIAANMSLFRFSGCKYFSIDGTNGSGGRALTLVLPSVFTTATNRVVDFISGVAPITSTNPYTTNNSVKNCNIIGNSTTSTIYSFAGVYMGGLNAQTNASVGNNGDNLIQNNLIGAVQFGIYIRSNNVLADNDNNNKVIGNTIGGTIAPNTTGNTNYFGGVANAAGIIMFSQTDAEISGNIIRNNHPGFGAPRGIELGTVATLSPLLSNAIKINGNTIDNIRTTVAGGAYGIYLNFLNNNANVNRSITISNNMISGISSPGSSASGTGFGNNPFGIYFNATGNIGTGLNNQVGVSLIYNSINLGVGSTLTSTGAISACLGIPSFIQGGVVSLNNIYQNRLGGTAGSTYAYGVALGGSTNPFSNSDQNNYYSSATTPTVAANFASAASTTPKLYNEWYEIMTITTEDTLSLTGLAPFTNDNDLYIPAFTSSNLYQAGKALFNITTDITGNPRNGFYSCIGAHEFDGVYNDNVAPRIFQSGNVTDCQSGPITLHFNIYDKLQFSDTLYYKLNSGTVQNIQANYKSGTYRQYVLPAQASGTLIEYRISSKNVASANFGAYPANKFWDTLSTGITSFPYTNGFEGFNNPAWASQTVSNNAMWIIGSMGSTSNPPQGANAGIRSAMFPSSSLASPNSVARLVSPCLDLSNMQSPTLRFYISQNSDLPTKRDSIQVKVSFGSNIWSNALRTVQRVNPSFALPGYTMVEVCLGAYKTSGMRLAFEAYGAGSGGNMQIDDITIYDDVQMQTFSPKIYNSCFRDSVKVTVTNTDARFLYQMIDIKTNQILSTNTGDGGTISLGLVPMPTDTVRFHVIASNTTSKAVNTGFGGGFVTCSNVLPDTVTAIINTFFNGPFLTAGTPFNGSYNAGNSNNPDGAKVGDTITYRIVAPSNFTNAEYGSKWSIPSIQAYAEASGAPFTAFTFVTPTPSASGYVRLIANASMLDSNIIFSYRMRLNASSCDSVFTRVIRITTAPVAFFNYTPPSTNLCANNEIFFDATGSTKPSNNFPFTYTWTFGDGSFSVVENPIKIYNAPGTYVVKFVLADRYGVATQRTETITVLPSPVVSYTTNVPCASDSTIFTPNTQPAGSSFLWSMPFNSTQTREVAKYNFPKYDTAYDVSLKVTNSSGCFVVLKKNIYVFAKPTANFSTSAHCLSSVVPITNTSTIPVGNMGYNWSWGNGETSLSATPTYKYPVSGTYSATLKVSSPFGCIDSMVKTITIYDRPFTGFNVVNACVGQDDETEFNNTTIFGGGAQNLNYLWTFADFSTSTDASPRKAFGSSGSSIVNLLAVDKLNGCRDSVKKTVTFNYKPVAQFATSPSDQTCENNELMVINTSYTIDNSPFKCLWIWGDSKTDTICSINHTYNAHGYYNITLVINTNNGCKDTMIFPITVNTIPELFITKTDIDTASFPYCKNRKLLKANLDNANSYEWKITGPGTNKTLYGQEIDNVFASQGKYIIVLTVNDASGCIVSRTDSVTVCGVGLESNLAGTYDLTAYPNPFGQSTTLSFELPKSTNVKVSILDMLGRTLKTKDFGRMQAGKHNELLEDFASAGSYLIKVEMDGAAIYKQVIKQ